MGSDTWNDAPAATGNGGWKPVDTSVNDGWQADSAGAAPADDGWNGISKQNVSKHADGPMTAHDGECRNCGEEGHFARDCPEPRREGGGGMTGDCYNCGQPGHNARDCTEPRVEREFTGECRLCGQTGHRRADCPEKPADKCKVCGEEGHDMEGCTANRLLSKMEGLKLDDATPENAWNELVKVDSEKEVEDIKKAIVTYARTYPSLTFRDLETVFRESSMNTYLIAKQQEVADTHTIVNLQGQIDQQYVISIQFGSKPRRAKFAEGWPQTSEENLERLDSVGFIMDRLVDKCSNCDQMGHKSNQCPEEKVEKTKLVITCVYCSEEGHLGRDCPNERPVHKKGCRNCGSEEHIAKECPEPRSAENVECKNCGEMGHFSKDCPSREPDLCRNCGQEGHRKADCTNERVMQCRNCDAWGHASRECDKPRDYSRVECRNCGEKGHTAVRCKNPPKEPEATEDAGAGAIGGASGGWEDNGAAANSGADAGGWGNGGEVAASGGW